MKVKVTSDKSNLSYLSLVTVLEPSFAASFDFQRAHEPLRRGGALAPRRDGARRWFGRSIALPTGGGAVGHVARAAVVLKEAGVEVFAFQDFESNPDTLMVKAGKEFAAPLRVDSIVGLGGGSSLDCAKGINFLLTNGGRMRDFLGYGKTSRPLLPMVGVPTTSGTGSEAQSYALISDAETHAKMACGDEAPLSARHLDPS